MKLIFLYFFKNYLNNHNYYISKTEAGVNCTNMKINIKADDGETLAEIDENEDSDPKDSLLVVLCFFAEHKDGLKYVYIYIK